jgi:hypothetical protein
VDALRWIAVTAVVFTTSAVARAHPVPGDGKPPAVEPGKQVPRYATVVSARRPPLLASQRVIDARELSVAPRRRSADDLLRLVPGVLLSQHGSEGKGQQIFLRGFDAAHGQDVEVLVGGVPINELSNIHGQGYLDLNFVIPEVVRQISGEQGAVSDFAGELRERGDGPLRPGGRRGEPRDARRVRARQHGPSPRGRGARAEAAGAGDVRRVRGDARPGVRAGAQGERVTGMGQVRLVDSKEYGTLDLFGAGYYAKFGSPGALTASDVADGTVPFAGVYQTDGGGRSPRAIASLRHQIDVGRGQARAAAVRAGAAVRHARELHGVPAGPGARRSAGCRRTGSSVGGLSDRVHAAAGRLAGADGRRGVAGRQRDQSDMRSTRSTGWSRGTGTWGRAASGARACGAALAADEVVLRYGGRGAGRHVRVRRGRSSARRRAHEEGAGAGVAAAADGVSHQRSVVAVRVVRTRVSGARGAVDPRRAGHAVGRGAGPLQGRGAADLSVGLGRGRGSASRGGTSRPGRRCSARGSTASWSSIMCRR